MQGHGPWSIADRFGQRLYLRSQGIVMGLMRHNVIGLVFPMSAR